MRQPAHRGLVVVSALLATAATISAIAGTVAIASGERSSPSRCAAGLLAAGARCCAEGQRLEGSRCTGTPRGCPPPLEKTTGGCVPPDRRVTYAGGRVRETPADWQSEHELAPSRIAAVGPYAIDAFEVTVHRWRRCVAAGICPALRIPEPGLPVTGVDVETAERYCRFAGGRLPTSAEWLFAAMGPEGRRYPWGMTGLVCRRAVYGLLDVCATGADSPEWSGTRPDGATPEGAHDLAGNVAEWTLDRPGGAVARGGSFRSSSARELKSTAVRHERPGAHVGFRCAYEVDRDDSLTPF